MGSRGAAGAKLPPLCGETSIEWCGAAPEHHPLTCGRPWEPWREAGGEALREKSLGLVGFNTEALLEQKAVWSVCLGPVCFICNLQGLNGAGSFGSEASMEPF